jgi:MFS family permease
MSAVFLAPLIGGAFSPAIAGAIAESLGWREIMWTCAILATVCEIVFLVLFRETYKVTILRRRAARLRKETGDKSIRTEFDKEEGSPALAFIKTMFRPVVVLSGSFILQGLSLWGGLVFTFFYIMATMLPDMLEDTYQFSPSQTGLSVLSFSEPSSTWAVSTS